MACGIIVPQPGMEPVPPTLEAWSLLTTGPLWTRSVHNFSAVISNMVTTHKYNPHILNFYICPIHVPLLYSFKLFKTISYKKMQLAFLLNHQFLLFNWWLDDLQFVHCFSCTFYCDIFLFDKLPSLHQDRTPCSDPDSTQPSSDFMDRTPLFLFFGCG